MAEIKLRAVRRVWKLSAALEKVHKTGRGKGRIQLPATGKLKREVLSRADVSTSQANRAEQVARISAERFERYIEERSAAGDGHGRS